MSKTGSDLGPQVALGAQAVVLLSRDCSISPYRHVHIVEVGVRCQVSGTQVQSTGGQLWGSRLVSALMQPQRPGLASNVDPTPALVGAEWGSEWGGT